LRKFQLHGFFWPWFYPSRPSSFFEAPALTLLGCLLTHPRQKAFKEGMFANFKSSLTRLNLFFLMFSNIKAKKLQLVTFFCVTNDA